MIRMNRVALMMMGSAVLAWGQTNNRDEKNRSVEVEAGAIFSGYNTVRIPRDSGTTFSLTRELTTQPGAFFRIRGNLRFNRHTVSLLVAPLAVNASGTVFRELHYAGTIFPADSFLIARYRFDSYRLTYRYTFLDNPGWTAAAGLTAKIRNAAIRVEGAGRMAEKANIGFVPLVNFHLEKKFGFVGVCVDGDALAAPPGRAEDVFFGALYKLGPGVRLYAGYRVLEGGSNVSEVYGFALFHYAAMGIKAYF